MKVSIITACSNNESTIEDSIQSVIEQTYKDIEYIVVDGASSDNSLEIIKRYENKITYLISEPDDGIYYALNKGIALANGYIIGFLHADDIYANNKVVETVVDHFKEHDVDCCYSDLVYISRKNAEKIIRFWKSSPYDESLLEKGWMPPHPTLFLKKIIYDRYGDFNTDFKISADYELILRHLKKNRISTYYIPEVLVKMRIGGASNKNLINLVRKTYEDYRAWKVNNLDFRIHTIFLKNISKIPQFFRRS
jgi:glycosyltransferase